MKILMILLAAIVLCGCGEPAVRHDIQIAKVPVAVSCIDKAPAKPVLHTDAEIKAMPDYEATITLLMDRIKREIYENNLEAALAGCQ